MSTTDLLPIVPPIVAFDGVVSCLRTYSPDELRELVDGLERADGWTWTIDMAESKKVPAGLTYLIGEPPG